LNAEDLSLIVIIVGTRGSGKTLLMTHFELEILSRAWGVKKLREISGKPNLYPRKKVNIWSNYPVKGLWTPPGQKKAVILESQPLDLERLIMWDDEFCDGVIFFDEIDQVADKQDWQSLVGKLLTAGVQMFRHRNLSLYASIQSLNWLNSRLQWQADVIIKCRDLSFTPWGKEKHVQPGEVANTTWIDKSGIMTGASFEENGMFYPLQFYGKRYWGSYSTHHEFNIIEYKRKYKLNLEAVEITDAGKVEKEGKDIEALHAAIEYFSYKDADNPRAKQDEFWDVAENLGFKGHRNRAGIYLKSAGVRLTGAGEYKYYHFENARIPQGVEVDK